MDTIAIKPGTLKGVNSRRDKQTGFLRQMRRGKRKLNHNKYQLYNKCQL